MARQGGHPQRTGAAPKLRTVDGLRGLAALLVVFDHTVGQSWGLGGWTMQNHGITAFALLSGFLLTSRFLRARLDGLPRPSTRHFLRDRAARIYPGYWVALAIAALTIGLHQLESVQIWQLITLTQTYGVETAFVGLPPTWSLSLFMSFYLALPAWFWWRSRQRTDGRTQAQVLRTEIAWIASLIPLSLLVRATNLTEPVSPDPVFTLLGRADWFAVGMILAAALIGHQRELLPRWVASPGRRPGLAAGGALTLTVVGALLPVHLEELRDQLDTAAGGLLVAAAVLHGQILRGPQRVLASRPAQALGRWSYGIFLWGYIVGKAIAQAAPGIGTAPQLALTMAGAIALGAASWRWVEGPAARWIKRRSARPREGVEAGGRLATAPQS